MDEQRRRRTPEEVQRARIGVPTSVPAYNPPVCRSGVRKNGGVTAALSILAYEPPVCRSGVRKNGRAAQLSRTDVGDEGVEFFSAQPAVVVLHQAGGEACNDLGVGVDDGLPDVARRRSNRRSVFQCDRGAGEPTPGWSQPRRSVGRVTVAASQVGRQLSPKCDVVNRRRWRHRRCGCGGGR